MTTSRRLDFDYVNVDRLIAGQPVLSPTPLELRSALDRLDRAGMSLRLLAERTGVSERTVSRHRARRRQSQHRAGRG